MSAKTFYLLQSCMVGDVQYRHIAFGDNLKELVNDCISFKDSSIDSFTITEFGSNKIVYCCFQEHTGIQHKKSTKQLIG